MSRTTSENTWSTECTPTALRPTLRGHVQRMSHQANPSKLSRRCGTAPVCSTAIDSSSPPCVSAHSVISSLIASTSDRRSRAGCALGPRQSPAPKGAGPATVTAGPALQHRQLELSAIELATLRPDTCCSMNAVSSCPKPQRRHIDPVPFCDLPQPQVPLTVVFRCRYFGLNRIYRHGTL